MLERHTGSEPVLPRMVQQKLEEHRKLMQENPQEFKKKLDDPEHWFPC